MKKTWTILPSPPPGIAESLGVSSFQAHLLFNRGITSRLEMDSFLNPDESLSHSPFLLPDMRKAIGRLEKAINFSETIGVFGDFDTDGISGTALIVSALRGIGSKVIPYLPNRVEEGHGLNEYAIRTLKSQGVSLLITVDCGTSSHEEIDLALSLGIDTIITDHHNTSSQLPNATAVVNPNRSDSLYPYDGLTGAGISLKLSEGLYEIRGENKPPHLYELAALGTVSDVGPITGENRFIVKQGLSRLNNTNYPGIHALINQINLKSGDIDTESLSFGIIPRLNASGRLSTAQTSLDLLLSENMDTALPLAIELDNLNLERRELTKEGVEKAKKQLKKSNEIIPPVIIVQDDQWIPGILGLIASNLSESYHRPVIAIKTEGVISRASARSIPEFDIIAELLKSSTSFIKVGGHPMAAGFTIGTQELPSLKSNLTTIASKRLNDKNLLPEIKIDCEIPPTLISNDTYKFIESLAPFGPGNIKPIFLTRNAVMLSSKRVGSGGEHLKMLVGHGTDTWNAIAFRQGGEIHTPGTKIDLVYSIQKNVWKGYEKLEMNVIDFRIND